MPFAVFPESIFMAYPNLTLISALRNAARQLRGGAPYAWGDHGSCNCGHLLQVVTHLSREEILRHARTGIGEWTEIAEDYCGVTEAPVTLLMSRLEAIGLTPTDIHCLEYLQDRAVLGRLPGGFRWLQKNVRADVILYFETFADLLEEQLLPRVDISLALPKPDLCPHAHGRISTEAAGAAH
ncbi:hypothetical protein [Flaviaesturariibacter flavus]|uniref:hypothetical protein n=1 Tax=Flaviaesturariibacter flavus TaxID=2502780 RepID=UPI001A9DBE2D|nr:hypothetical protein [Flaviaesturariibacter flavus]